MIELGDLLTDVGYSIIPISFFGFLMVRFLEFKWNINISKLIKSIWYLSLGLSMLTKDIRVDLIVMLIALIESYDLFFQYLEEKKVRASKNS